MMYFQTIIKRDEDEITKRIYVCQKNNPVKGDWIELLKNDFADLEIDMDEELISKETKLQFKTRIRKQLKTHMLAEMKQQQAGHSKIRDISYNSFKTQEYLRSHMFNNHEAFLLFSLRSRNCKLFKANFPYYNDQVCPNNGCQEKDTQEHCIECDKIVSSDQKRDTISYNDIFSCDITKQLGITKLFASLLEGREVASAKSTGPQCCPGSPRECSDHCPDL